MISLLRDSWVKLKTSPGICLVWCSPVNRLWVFYFPGCNASTLCCFCGANPGGLLPYMGYIGMCSPKGQELSAVLLINRASILTILPPFW